MGQEMPIFYFNIVSASGTIADVEGTELATLEDAKREAIRDARALMSQAVLSGKDISAREVRVCGDDGGVLLIVPFTEAIRPFE